MSLVHMEQQRVRNHNLPTGQQLNVKVISLENKIGLILKKVLNH